MSDLPILPSPILYVGGPLDGKRETLVGRADPAGSKLVDGGVYLLVMARSGYEYIWQGNESRV